MILKLALKNILGAGLRTWLNVVALSISYVAIIAMQGFYSGLIHQIERSSIEVLYAGGQYWQQDYDPFDPLRLDDSHGKIPENISDLIEKKNAVPILIRTATIYPNGRIQPAMLKGIPPEQTILSLPTVTLKNGEGYISALIGRRMAKTTGLKVGDFVTVRWRDKNGTFDAGELKIVEIMKTSVIEVDNGQLWVPIEKLRELTELPGEATKIVIRDSASMPKQISDWNFKDLDFLLKDSRAFIKADNFVALIFYVIFKYKKVTHDENIKYVHF